MDRQTYIDEIKKSAVRLDSYDDLDLLVDRIGDAQYVLLGESSHGTSEFYTLRAELSKRLIQRKGFHFIAVEGDWPSCYSLNRYIKLDPGADETPQRAMRAFNRWPSWMWANEELIPLLDWMREWNSRRSGANKIGFYGLDVYSLWESMEDIIQYLTRTNSPELAVAKQAFACFEPYNRSEQTYGMSAAFLSESCEQEVVRLLRDLRMSRQMEAHIRSRTAEQSLSAELNALVAVNAERYYRAMVRGGPASWNIRDQHMVQVLRQLTDFHGPGSKAIIWEHNTHIGDARATDMALDGMVNVGQLLREEYGDKVYAIGFGTHRGTVIAGSSWGAPLQEMPVPPAAFNSWEDLMHRAGAFNKILFLGHDNPHFLFTVGHRAIGVVYHPEYEHRGNYVPSIMSERYDAFVHVEETRALRPLVLEEVLEEVLV